MNSTATITLTSNAKAGVDGPQRLRNILIAFLLSLGAGIGLAFLLDFLDDTVKTVDDVDRYLHLPALALIPVFLAYYSLFSYYGYYSVGGTAATEFAAARMGPRTIS